MFVLVAKPKMNISCVHKSCLRLGRGSGLRVLHENNEGGGGGNAGSAVQHWMNPLSFFNKIVMIISYYYMQKALDNVEWYNESYTVEKKSYVVK